MYYLIHLDPPFWEILESNLDFYELEKIVYNHQGPNDVYPTIPAGELTVVDEVGLEAIKNEFTN